MSFLWAIPPVCLVLHEWQLYPQAYQLFPQFSLIHDLMGGGSSSSSLALVKVLSWIGLIGLCVTSLVIGLQVRV